jgi:hypothetical protein
MYARALVVSAALLAGASAHANVLSTVPNAFAAAPGTGVFLGPLVSSGRTYQLLIDSSQLTAHLGNEMTAISFRLPASATAAWPAADVNFGAYDIRLSGSVAPSDRSLTFANNVVGAQTLVRSGALSIPAGSFSAGASPNAFGLSIGFDSGYLYTGGNLLIEIRHTGFTGTSASVDAMLATGGAAQGYGTLFSAAWTGSYTGLSGSQGNFAVLQISSVPEPATLLSMALGLAGLAGFMARRRVKRAGPAAVPASGAH